MLFRKQKRPLLPLILLVAGLSLAGESAEAQTEKTIAQKSPEAIASPVQGKPKTQTLTQAQVEEQIAKVDASDLEDPIKESLRSKFREVSKVLAKAKAAKASLKSLRDLVDNAPAKVAELEAQLHALPPVEVAGEVPADQSADVLRDEIEQRRSALADLESRYTEAETAFARTKARPVEIGTRLPAAASELKDVETQLAAAGDWEDAPPGKVADAMLLLAKRQALTAEIELLKQEQLSQDQREQVVAARYNLLQRQRENEQAALAAREDRLQETVTSDAERISTEVEGLVEKANVRNEASEMLATEIQELAANLLSTTEQLQATDSAHDAVAARNKALQNDFKRLEELEALGGLEGAFAQVLLDQRRRLPKLRALDDSIEERQELLGKVRLGAFRVDEKTQHQSALEERFREEGGSDPEELLKKRAELLKNLDRNYRALIRDLARLDADERAYRNQILDFRSYLIEKMFWRKSSPPADIGFLASLPSGVAWLLGAQRWAEGLRTLEKIPAYHPFLVVFAILTVGVLIGFRPFFARSLVQCGTRIRRISTDRYSHTLKALGFTILLAAPSPLTTGFLGWAILATPNTPDWMEGFAKGLLWSTGVIAGVAFLRGICRTGGLGPVHFGWRESTILKLRSALTPMLTVYVLALLVTTTTLYEESSQHFNGIGRFSFAVAHLCIAGLFAFAFRPSDGILCSIIKDHPGGIISRTRYLWYWLLVLAPVFLVVLALAGYAFTALTLSTIVLATLEIVAASVILYALALRWFMIKERRLALQEAIERRRAQKAATKQPTGEDSPDELIAAEEDEKLDLEAVGEQTRRLLRSLAVVGMILGIWFLWSNAVPTRGKILDEKSAGTMPGFLRLVRTIVTIVIGAIMVRNLPGLLELAGLRSSTLNSGTRYAIATLSQYTLTAIVALEVFRVLDLDWSQFGWIAAALSVGLGFGLQEIVANFVCGIIILFEQPIRVGDVVTVEAVTGTVTRIRMRAATITNWDRQEFVVPNKQFITGSLINWTLSSPVNRVVIPVGVAYGTDARRAREILLEVAKDHPRVLKDPAPMATFEEFADSSLSLTLRCYVPDMNDRLNTITELHDGIDERFKEARIEIAFPQQDVHIKGFEPKAPKETTP